MRTVAITLPETLLARVDEAAEAEADSRSAWIRDAILGALPDPAQTLARGESEAAPTRRDATQGHESE